MANDPISSLQNDRVKLAYSLQNRARARRKEHKCALEGTRLIMDAVDAGQRPIFVLYQAAVVDYETIAALQEVNTSLIPVTSEVIDHISDTQNPQGIVGVFPLPRPQATPNATFALVLDAVQDPGNMGTILRTAAAAGVELVFLGPGCVDPYNPKVLRAGMGAHFRVPIYEGERGEIRGFCADKAVYIAASDGDLVHSDADWSQPAVLVIGNEAHGVGETATLLQGERLRIPMASETESLNAAVATGVILFEAQRQRRQA